MSQVDLDAVKNEAKRRIKNLVEDYMRVIEAGKKESFNEERVKIAFMLPMIEALGWNPRTDEVLPEQATLTGRADFGLRVGGRTKIFVELKRFSKSLDGHYTVKGKPRSFAEQAIQYAWGMKADWAALTNFEETRLYDSHVKKPKDGLVWKKPIRFTEYESRFDELWLISRQSVVSGALDAYKAKIERPPVDKAFLDDLMNCRQLLAEDIKNNNPGLTYYQINESVQKILDRLIFIKNCEDRLIIPAESLWKRYKAWQETAIDKEIVIFMMDLKNLFRYFDQVYNGKLFEKHPCEDLRISNEVFEEIIDTLYGDGQHLGYNFSVIPVDVLGQAYELYIGSIIKEKEGQAKAVEIAKKPAKRKAHGIYYTPEPIVDYIVRSTLGKVLEKCKTPEDVSRIKVLDPACGSGSFLIKAFDVIREWYENYNRLNRPISVPGTLDAHIVPVPNIEERILTENLYGVDLDPQAIEITILNLSLKGVKTKEKLPYMADHIKCGNSLIDDEKIAGDNAFKWEGEFEEIMKKGGFDVVIGNPPYGGKLSEIERDFISSKFKFSSSYKNTALIFIEKSLELINKNGYFGMIVPKSIAFSQRWKSGRELVKEHLVKVADVSKAFEEVLLEQVVIILSMSTKPKYYILQDIFPTESMSIDNKFIDSTDSIILHGEKKDFEIFKKMNETSRYLSDITRTGRGLPFQKYLVKEKTGYPVVKGKNISRHQFRLSDEYLPEKIVDRNKSKVNFLQQPKIISQRIVAHVTKPKDHIIIMSALDSEGLINVDTVENTITTDNNYSLEFLLCLLNSKLISWYAYRYIFSKAIRTMDLDNYYLGKIPLPNAGVKNNVFINSVDKMLFLKKRLNEIGDQETDEKARLEHEVKKTDAKIDKLVYEFYGLTEAEKKIIEEGLE